MGAFPQRNRWKKGDWLIIDEESGMTRYASKVMRDYTGAYVTRRYADYEQPQDFVKAFNDPQPVPFAAPGISDFDVCVFEEYYIGETTIVAPRDGPAAHLFDPGIGDMEIECSFFVRPDINIT